MIQSQTISASRVHQHHPMIGGHSLSLEAQAMAEDIKGFSASKRQARKMKASAVKEQKRASDHAVKQMRQAAKKSMWGSALSLVAAGLSVAGSITGTILDGAKKTAEVAKKGIEAASKTAKTAKGIGDWVVIGLNGGGKLLDKTAGTVQSAAGFDQADAAKYRAESDAHGVLVSEATESLNEYNSAMQRTINRINTMQQGKRR